MINDFLVRKDKENKSDEIISLALMSSFIVLTFQYLILISFNLLGTSSASLVQTLSKVIVGIIFVVALPHILKRKLKVFVLIYALGAVIFGYNFLVFPENHAHLINLIFPFFFTSLPTLIYVLTIKDLKIFYKITEKAAYIIFFLGTIISILIFTGNASAGVYSMSLSYYMLLPALIFLGKIFDKVKIIYIIYFILALTVILALGSRGALLCIAVYAILRIISPRQVFSFTKVFVYGIFTMLLGLIFLNYEKILLFLNKIFSEFGIQSRTINLLLQDEVSLSGRDSIIQTVWKEITQSPFLGIGLSGDTSILGNSYVHNFFIEFIGNFGIPAGVGLLVILLLILINSLFFSENYNLVVLWLSLGFIHLMVSSSYIIDVKFWVLIGILIKSIHINLSNENRGGLK